MNRWYRLDNIAKLFPSVTGTNNSSVFRISAVLDCEIDKDILQKSVDHIYERFPTMFVKLSKGLFWNYFENTSEKFLVEEEFEYPCAAIDSKIKGGFLTKVLFHNKRISIEMFHALADGNGGMEFLKSIVFYYLKFSGIEVESENKVMTVEEGVWNSELEDSFNRHYKKTGLKYGKNRKAFRIRGEHFDMKGTNVISGIVDVAELSQFTKKEGYGFTVYLISTLAASIYETRIKYSHSKRPLVIAVPVNLRGVFESKTLRNFFGVVNISLDMKALSSFEDIIEEVKKQLKEKTTKEYLEVVVEDNLKVAKSKYSRLVPLIIKNLLVRLGFAFFGEEKKTITFSNMGNNILPKSMEEHIKHFETILYPTAKSPINCCMSSFNNKLVINFSRSIEEDDVIKHFFNSIAEKGIATKVYSNNWGKDFLISNDKIYSHEEVKYPDYKDAYKVSKTITLLKVFLFVTICLGAIGTLVNIYTFDKFGVLWAVIGDFVMAVIWLILLISFSKRIKFGGKILSYFWIIAILLFLIDIFTGFHKWSTTYIIPFMTIIVTFLITLIAIARRKLYKEYMGYLLIAVFTGICPILLFAFFLSDKLWTCLAAVLYSVLTLIGLLIFSDKSFKKEMVKRFHY